MEESSKSGESGAVQALPDPLSIPSPQDTIQDAFEQSTVSSASRMVQAVQRAPAAIQGLAAQWLAASSAALAPPPSSKTPPAPNLTAALYEGASAFQLQGQDPGQSFQRLWHALGADGFYKYNVDDSWKKVRAMKLGIADPDADPGSWKPVGSEVYQSWAEEIGSGGGAALRQSSYPSSNINGFSGAYSWWTPAQAMQIPTSSSRDQGLGGYFQTCQVVSLAPDWYAWGTITVSWGVGPSPKLKRPEPFDGNNPLWVQRPADRPARTGGEAIEVLLGDTLTLSETDQLSVHLVPNAVTDAIRATPALGAYAENLSVLSTVTDTPENRLAVFLKMTVVRQCRAARQGADALFDQQAYAGAVGGQR